TGRIDEEGVVGYGKPARFVARVGAADALVEAANEPADAGVAGKAAVAGLAARITAGAASGTAAAARAQRIDVATAEAAAAAAAAGLHDATVRRRSAGCFGGRRRAEQSGLVGGGRWEQGLRLGPQRSRQTGRQQGRAGHASREPATEPTIGLTAHCLCS